MSEAKVDEQRAYENTDRELWRREGGEACDPHNFYQPSIHVTKQGAIGINVGGTVYVKSVEDWHALAGFFETYQRLQRLLFEFKQALEDSHR